MSNLSSNFRYLLFLQSLLLIKYSFALSCEPPDRKYSCDCFLKPANRSVFVERNGQYNASVDNFVPAIKSLQYCHGSFFCKPDFKQNQPLEMMVTNNYLVCFSDDSCLTGQTRIISTGNIGDSCVTKCMNLENLQTFNITNDVLETEEYKCIKVGQEGIKPQYCLNPACHSFTAVEKLCVCNYQSQNCSCSSYCQNLQTIVSHKTYALFLSFGDIYLMTGAKVNYLQYFILTVLCIGSMIIVIVFCNFYITVDRISVCNEARNTEALRRILTATLDPSPPPLPALVKDDTCVEVCRGSPPPTYEQVLKDKCVEFKKSMA